LAWGWVILTVEVAGLVITLGGLFLAYRGVRDQLWLMTFAEYTKRYSDIMSDLPFEARRPGSPFDIHALREEERTQVLQVMRSYFNLCSEELYLHQKGRIDSDTWEVWTEGTAEVMRFPCFDFGWGVLRQEYESFPDFQKFIDEQLVQALRRTPVAK
jgi:hypothetical protein